MRRQRKNRFVLMVAALALILCISSGLRAQQYELEVLLDTVNVTEGQKGIVMPVVLKNPFDDIAGFDLFVYVDRPDICSLRTVMDTTGSLISDWPVRSARDLGSEGIALRYLGLWAQPPDTFGTVIQPQAGDTLFNLVIDMVDVLTPFDAGARLVIQTAPVDLFGFSDSLGNSIGLGWQYTETTECWLCEFWAPPDSQICLEWERVSLPPCDSTWTYQDSILVIDTSLVHVVDGWLQIVPWTCGDFNGDGSINLTDVTLLVNFLFAGGDAPEYIDALNVAGACDSGVNLTDLTVFVNALFLGGPPLQCCPSN